MRLPRTLNGGFALVAALKAGTFEPAATFVRVYDPSNIVGNTIVLDVDGLVAAQGGGAFTVQIVTALEQAIAEQHPQATRPEGSRSRRKAR